jgi:Uma2 family endonuclease
MLDVVFPESQSVIDEMPSFNHSYLCTQIIRQLLQYPDLLPMTELTLAIENGLTPDISVYPLKQIHPDFFNDITRYDELPIFAIEVVSSSQPIQMILQKAKKLVDAGISQVLTLEPYSRTVFITQKDKENQFVHNGTVEIEGCCKIDFRSIFEAHHAQTSQKIQ